MEFLYGELRKVLGECMKIFIATAIENQNTVEQQQMFDLRSSLVAVHGPKSVFLATYEFQDPSYFLPYRESLDLVMNELQNSDYFVLYYPRKVASGAIMELAWAISWNKPILILTDSIDSIPYMVRGGFKRMKIVVRTEPIKTHFDIVQTFIGEYP